MDQNSPLQSNKMEACTGATELEGGQPSPGPQVWLTIVDFLRMHAAVFGRLPFPGESIEVQSELILDLGTGESDQSLGSAVL